jgi:hypothetical protein
VAPSGSPRGCASSDTPRRWRSSAPTAATGGRSACSTAPRPQPGWWRFASNPAARRASSSPPSAWAPQQRSGTKSAVGGCGSGGRCYPTATRSTWWPRPASVTAPRPSWSSPITTPLTAGSSSIPLCHACSRSASRHCTIARGRASRSCTPRGSARCSWRSARSSVGSACSARGRCWQWAPRWRWPTLAEARSCPAPTTISAPSPYSWRWPLAIRAPDSRRARAAALDRLGGVVHGGHAGLHTPPPHRT